MHIQDTLLLLPENTSGVNWDKCIRSENEDYPHLKVHKGTRTPFRHRAIHLNSPVVLSLGNQQKLLHALDQGVACVVFLSNSGIPRESMTNHILNASLVVHSNSRIIPENYRLILNNEVIIDLGASMVKSLQGSANSHPYAYITVSHININKFPQLVYNIRYSGKTDESHHVTLIQQENILISFLL